MSGSTAHASHACVLRAHRISVGPTVGKVCWKVHLIAIRHCGWLLWISMELLLLLVPLPACLEAALLVWCCHVGSLLIGHARVTASPATVSTAIVAAARGMKVSLLLRLNSLLRVLGLCLSLLGLRPYTFTPPCPTFMLGGCQMPCWGGICTWAGGCCICTAFASAPPCTTVDICCCSVLMAACSYSFWALAADASVRSSAIASIRHSSARWRSSRLLASPCGTPMPREVRRRRSAATNTLRRAGMVFCDVGRISHSLQSRGYSPDLCRLRYTIPLFPHPCEVLGVLHFHAAAESYAPLEGTARGVELQTQIVPWLIFLLPPDLRP